MKLNEKIIVCRKQKGYSQEEIEAQVICFEALRRMQEGYDIGI